MYAPEVPRYAYVRDVFESGDHHQPIFANFLGRLAEFWRHGAEKWRICWGLATTQKCSAIIYSGYTADQIAEKLGIGKTSMLRARAGISYTLVEAVANGHCALP